MRRLRIPVTLVAGLPTVLFGAGALAACSTGSSTAGSTTVTNAPGPTGSARGSGGGQRQPRVSGLVAAVSGSTMQVQSQTKQTAVTWTATTAFTRQQPGTAADVTVGACVAVRPASGATATGDPVTAATVQIVPAGADGSCSGGLGGGGAPPSATPGGMPGAGPNEVPPGAGVAASGGPGPGAPYGRGAGAGVLGKVTAASGASLTLARTAPGGDTSSAAPVTVTLSGSTTYAKTVQASAKDVAVGQCATAQGQTTDTGAVTATSIAVRAPVSGSCFGGATSTAGGATGG